MKKLALVLFASLLSACGETTPTEKGASPSPEINQRLWTASEITSGQLGGTLHFVSKDAPIVIIVPGSGPTDKDGNSMGFVANSYKYLAEGLGDNGISTIRVDKRGMFSSAKAGDGNQVTVDLYAEDYRRWVKTAIAQTGQSCAFLLGHSEGGLMVTAAAIGQDNICGVITVASPGFRLSDVMRKQFKDNPVNAPILDDALGALDRLEAGEKVDVSAMHPALKQVFSPLIQDYMISLFKVDPAELLAKVSVPKLVVQGSHDIQVSVDDAKRLAEKGGAKLVILDGISHVLKPAPADFAANVQTYNSPDEMVDERVIMPIVRFAFAPE